MISVDEGSGVLTLTLDGRSVQRRLHIRPEYSENDRRYVVAKAALDACRDIVWGEMEAAGMIPPDFFKRQAGGGNEPIPPR